MKTDLYERIWMGAVGVVLVFFFGTLANAALRHGFSPPSHIETIDPRRVFQSPGFRQQGVSVDAQGGVHVTVLGMMFAWMPAELVLPTARRMADAIVKGAPLCVRAITEVVRGTEDMSVEQAFRALDRREFPIHAAAFKSEDRKEGPRAFVEKRAPVWSGR